MKTGKGSKIAAFVLAASVITGSVFMTSCNRLTDGAEQKEQNAAQEQTVNQTVNQTVENNTITIEGADGEGLTYSVAKGLRSVVSVYCTFEATMGGTSFWNPTPTTYNYYTTGSGVIYELEEDGSAFIVTNHHVVYDADSNTENRVSDKIYVYLYGMEDEQYAIPATFVGGSANYDIAVLRIDKSEVLKNALATGAAAEAAIGNSDWVNPGDTTIAIGNPSATELGGISVTKGIVSVDSEYITMNAVDGSGEISLRVIRTDAPVNGGNSGGGMFNAEGELIGIVNAKITSSDIENIGFAIPVNVARAIADNIIDYCYGKECETVMRGLMGVTVTVKSLSTDYDENTGLLVRNEEVAIYEVSTGGLGSQILEAGDVIKSITVGERKIDVTRQYHLIDAMLDVRVGDEISIDIVRGSEEMTVSAVITEECLAAY